MTLLNWAALYQRRFGDVKAHHPPLAIMRHLEEEGPAPSREPLLNEITWNAAGGHGILI